MNAVAVVVLTLFIPYEALVEVRPLRCLSLVFGRHC